MDAIGALDATPPARNGLLCGDTFRSVLEYFGPGTDMIVYRDNCDLSGDDPALALINFLVDAVRKPLAPERRRFIDTTDPRVVWSLGE